MQIKFKKLHPDAVAPKQGTPGSAGFDITAIGGCWNSNRGVYEYSTGLAVEIPAGYVGLAFPRSSVYKTGLLLSNCVGVIDSDYRGEIGAKFYANVSYHGGPYIKGDRIFQLVIVPVPEVEYVEVDELSDTDRGNGGFGSTGK